MLLPQMVSSVVWMIAVIVFGRLSVLPKGLFLQRCSTGPLLPSCISEEGSELQNVLWGLSVVLSGTGSLHCVPVLVGTCLGAGAAVANQKTEEGDLLQPFKAVD